MKEKFLNSLLIWLVSAYGLIAVNMSIIATRHQHFAYLARSLMQGKLYLIEIPELGDTVIHAGHIYWPLGLFPAIVMVLPVWIFDKFGILFNQTMLQPVLVTGVFWLVFRLAEKVGSRGWDRAWWAAAFVMGSTFSGVGLLSWSWQFAQVITVFLLFWAIIEYFGQRNYGLIGLVMGLVFLTRPTAGLGIIYFGWSAWKSKDRWKNLFWLGWPFGAAVGLSMGYNYLRFGNIFESGYLWQILESNLEKARSYGLFSLKHIPGNVYEFLIASPKPILQDGESMVLKWPYLEADRWGMAIWFTSTYLIKMFTQPMNLKWMKPMLAASGIVALPIFLYYGVGAVQVGYRYALDFLPWIHMVCMGQNGNRKLTVKYKLLIFLGGLLNVFWFKSVYLI